jgi:hypothetical protein
MRTIGKNIWGIFIAVALAGCGPSSGGGKTFSTTVPSGEQVQNLTAAQASQLCGDITSYLTDQIESPGLCQAAAVVATASQAAQDPSLTDAQLQQICSFAATTVCQMVKADAGTGGTANGGAPSCGSTAGCTATVAQLSACINDIGGSFSTFERMFPNCGMVTRAALAAVNQSASPVEPASCVPLDTSCPGFGPMASVGATDGAK